MLLGALILLFSLTKFVPGNPARVLLGPRASDQAVAALGERMGLDLPIWRQLAALPRARWRAAISGPT